MSFIYKENNSGPRTVPCGTPDKTGTHRDFAPLTTTLYCMLHRNESIHTKVFFTYAISMEIAFMRRSVKGLLEIQYECIYLTPCIQNFGSIFYYCDQLSFTATVLPESMLPVFTSQTTNLNNLLISEIYNLCVKFCIYSIILL